MTPHLTQTDTGWSFTLPHVTMRGFRTQADALRAAKGEADFVEFKGEAIQDQLARLGLFT